MIDLVKFFQVLKSKGMNYFDGGSISDGTVCIDSSSGHMGHGDAIAVYIYPDTCTVVIYPHHSRENNEPITIDKISHETLINVLEGINPFNS